MPNFVNVGGQYILSNLDVKIPKVDSILNVTSSGDIKSMPICRDWLKSFHDGTSDDAILTFGSMKEYGVVAGSSSVFGGYKQKWKLTNEWQNIGNVFLDENTTVKRTFDTMILKRAVYATVFFNGYVTNKGNDPTCVWYRIVDKTKNISILEGILQLVVPNYEVSFNASVPAFFNKDTKLGFEMSCKEGGNIEVNGPSTYGWLVGLNLYEEEYHIPSANI